MDIPLGDSMIRSEESAQHAPEPIYIVNHVTLIVAGIGLCEARMPCTGLIATSLSWRHHGN